MLDSCMAYFRKNTSFHTNYNKPCHLFGEVIELVENRFLEHHKWLQRKAPAGFPNDEDEKIGHRRYHAFDARYQDHKVRIGTLELHIRNIESNRQVAAVAIFYIGEELRMPLSFGTFDRMSSMAEHVGYVVLVDDGTIGLAYYKKDQKPTTLLWLPDSYPTSLEETSGVLQSEVRKKGMAFLTKTCKALPSLVMLAIEAYTTTRKAAKASV